MFELLFSSGSEGVEANHSQGNGARCTFVSVAVLAPLNAVACVGVGARSLLRSRPKSLAELVNALGRPVGLVAEVTSDGYTRVGAGDISMGTGDS